MVSNIRVICQGWARTLDFELLYSMFETSTLTALSFELSEVARTTTSDIYPTKETREQIVWHTLRYSVQVGKEPSAASFSK